MKANQENLANTVALLASFADGVADLEPPGEIKNQHEELLGAMRAFSRALNTYADDISNVASMEQLQAFATSEDLEAAGSRSAQACLAMEQIAADAGVEIDLRC